MANIRNIETASLVQVVACINRMETYSVNSNEANIIVKIYE